MALLAPVRPLPRPNWLHAGFLFGAAVAGVLLTSGHAQAVTPVPVATALSAPVAAAPAPSPVASGLPVSVLPVVPVATPVAPPGSRFVAPVVGVAKPTTVAVRSVIVSANTGVRAVVHSVVSPSL